MTKYHVTAWCNFPRYTTFEVEARSFAEALIMARDHVPDEFPEPCDGRAVGWEDYQIHAEGREHKSGTYFDPPRRVEVAAPDLLEAAILAEDVLSELARLDDGTPSISALGLLRAAINKATKG